MKKILPLLILLSVCVHVVNAKVYRTSGEGRGVWHDPASWVLDGTDEMPSVPPSPDDHVIIEHYLIHSIRGTYEHRGDIEVMASGVYEVNRPLSSEATLVFSGRQLQVMGTLFANIHLSLSDEALLTLGASSALYLNGNLVLRAASGMVSEANSCGQAMIHGDLILPSEEAFLTGDHRLVVEGNVRGWMAQHREAGEGEAPLIRLAARLGAGTNLYATTDACEADLPLVVGTNEALQPGVTWAGFEVESVAKEAHLSWYTDREQFVRDFTVERSFDGLSFHAVEHLDARGRHGLGETYEFVDRIPDHVTVTYRIRQNTLSGAYTYSETREVSQTVEQLDLSVFPNPSRNHRVQVQGQGLTPDEPVHVSVRTTHGDLVQASTLDADHNGRLSITGLPSLGPGLYLIIMQQGDHQLVQRLTIY